LVQRDLLQKGFLSPVGLRALSELVSVPLSSEIFSSPKRDEGAFSSSSGRGLGAGGQSEFIGEPPNSCVAIQLYQSKIHWNTLNDLRRRQIFDAPHRKISGAQEISGDEGEYRPDGKDC
jgi:hypothetical protein